MYSRNEYFTLDFYDKLINIVTKSICVKNYQNHKTGLILRHDVDLSIDLAYKFSRIEKKNSKMSTYYILMTSDLYNPFSNGSKKIIKSMLDEGFEIGLHFDPTVYGDISEKELEEKFYNEIDIFESVFNFKIQSYSLHNLSINGESLNFKGIINAYNTDIFSDECYISDSSFSFRGKDAIKFIKKSENKLVQFLTHPAQYFSQGEVTYEKAMNVIINNYYKKFDKSFQLNRIYSKQKSGYHIKINGDLW